MILELATELRLAGFSSHELEQMSIPELSSTLRMVDKIQSRELVEVSWLWMCAAQGRDKDLKKQLAGRLKRAKGAARVMTAKQIKERM